MKNLFAALAVLSLPFLLNACGKKSEAPPSEPQPEQAKAAAQTDLAVYESIAPKALPPCPGFLSVADVQGDVQQGSAALLSEQAPSALVEFYAEHLAAEGWTLGASVVQAGIQHLQFSRNGQLLRLQIGPAAESGGSQLSLAWKQPTGVREFDEAHAPEPDDEDPEPGSQGSVEW